MCYSKVHNTQLIARFVIHDAELKRDAIEIEKETKNRNYVLKKEDVSVCVQRLTQIRKHELIILRNFFV